MKSFRVMRVATGHIGVAARDEGHGLEEITRRDLERLPVAFFGW
jgi:hypothetical protein